MSTSAIIALLSISEIALLTTALAVFLFVRSKKYKNSHNLKPHAHVKMVDTPHAGFPDFLEKYMLKTEKRMHACDPEEVHLLSKRLEFLQSELQAFKDTENDDVYWSGICDRMSKLVTPQQLEQTAAKDNTLNELDDIDSSINNQSDIPVLDEQVSPDASPPQGSVTVDTSKDDIARLSKIIGRQHNSIDELKQTLFKNKNLDAAESSILAEKLEEIEVSHEQLNMCVEVLQQENQRLNSVIGSMAFGDESVNIDATIADLSDTKQELEKANELITDLVVEKEELTEKVQNLEVEIISLEDTLRIRTAELEQARSLESDLSSDEHDGDIMDSEGLRKEIEDISQLLATKSEQLSILQQQMESPSDTSIESSPSQGNAEIELSTTDTELETSPITDSEIRLPPSTEQLNNDIPAAKTSTEADLEFDGADTETDNNNNESNDGRPVMDDVDLDEVAQQFDESTPDNSPDDPDNNHDQPPDLDATIHEILDSSADTRQKTG